MPRILRYEVVSPHSAGRLIDVVDPEAVRQYMEERIASEALNDKEPTLVLGTLLRRTGHLGVITLEVATSTVKVLIRHIPTMAQGFSPCTPSILGDILLMEAATPPATSAMRRRYGVHYWGDSH